MPPTEIEIVDVDEEMLPRGSHIHRRERSPGPYTVPVLPTPMQSSFRDQRRVTFDSEPVHRTLRREFSDPWRYSEENNAPLMHYQNRRLSEHKFSPPLHQNSRLSFTDEDESSDSDIEELDISDGSDAGSSLFSDEGGVPQRQDSAPLPIGLSNTILRDDTFNIIKS
ncbi:hypothetical protein K469DRAFT_123534 [Zopfia rhizophila CBS 207.26]|uniref:Uncharacterized protein n=1 Tax=Zopfia rhizophila CBS 207.26 TaxID=1314779 RepID=A0A6A6E7U6_9PEZI|nr:hypothetical protein K469DRAFT_123534 [Zopfia rhizophila CBS 207.26]